MGCNCGGSRKRNITRSANKAILPSQKNNFQLPLNTTTQSTQKAVSENKSTPKPPTIKTEASKEVEKPRNELSEYQRKVKERLERIEEAKKRRKKIFMF